MERGNLNKLVQYGFDTVTELIHKLDKQDTAMMLELQHLRDDLAEIVQIVRGPNGKDSLTIRMNVIEIALDGLTRKINDMLTHGKEFNIESTKGRWMMLVAIISGLSGLVGSILTVIFK